MKKPDSAMTEAFDKLSAMAERVTPISLEHELHDFADEAIRIINKFKPRMEKRGLRAATCHCKFCGGKDTIVMQLGRFKHRGNYPFHFNCRTKGCGFMMLT